MTRPIRRITVTSGKPKPGDTHVEALVPIELIDEENRLMPGALSPHTLEVVSRVDRWLDEQVSETYIDQPLAQDWARVAKVAEEVGEAVDALIKLTGQNPRKGKCGTLDELLGELADTALTGILAIQHFTKDTYVTDAILSRSFANVSGRVTA